MPTDTFNVTVSRELSGCDPRALARENIDYFQSKKFPMAFWLWDSPHSETLAEALLELGLVSFLEQDFRK
ncbi:hypothetical protein MYX78_08020 [Acidobacteria bacterium AH-259-G07]|nr:hypothetical protein [Acidobacteria bacterium AH-259-G07]